MTAVEAWLSAVKAEAAKITATYDRYSREVELVDEILHNAVRVAIEYPNAVALADPGDGLRSPALTGATSGGGHGSMVEATAIDHADRTDRRQGKAKRPPALVASDRARSACLASLRQAVAAARPVDEDGIPIYCRTCGEAEVPLPDNDRCIACLSEAVAASQAVSGAGVLTNPVAGATGDAGAGCGDLGGGQ